MQSLRKAVTINSLVWKTTISSVAHTSQFRSAPLHQFTKINIQNETLYRTRSSRESMRYFSESHTSKEERKKLQEDSKKIIRKIKQRHKEEEEVENVPKEFAPKIRYYYNKAIDMGWRFWYGARDLWNNTKAANLLAKRLKEGEKLPRKDHRFILQNRRDLRSLVPFFLVWRIPIFGDFVLPFFIARFPGLLPSTFKIIKSPSYEDRIKLARMKQRALFSDISDDKLSVIRKIAHAWKALPYVTAKDVIEQEHLLSKLKIENLTGQESAALCSMLQLGTRLPNYFLKRRLNNHFKHLQQDNELLEAEGVDDLDVHELDQAALERGLRILGLSIGALEDELEEFVSLGQQKPHLLPSLLIYAHAFEERELHMQSIFRENEDSTQSVS